MLWNRLLASAIIWPFLPIVLRDRERVLEGGEEFQDVQEFWVGGEVPRPLARVCGEGRRGWVTLLTCHLAEKLSSVGNLTLQQNASNLASFSKEFTILLQETDNSRSTQDAHMPFTLL